MGALNLNLRAPLLYLRDQDALDIIAEYERQRDATPIDGGFANSQFGGVEAIDGGDVTGN